MEELVKRNTIWPNIYSFQLLRINNGSIELMKNKAILAIKTIPLKKNAKYRNTDL